MRYDDDDLLDIVSGNKTKEQVAEKYNTKISVINRAMSRRGLWVRKKRIEIITPYGNKVCNSITETANELGLSHESIRRALRGLPVKMLTEMEIIVRYYKGGNQNGGA